MFLLRRAALRAASSTSASITAVARPRAFTGTFTRNFTRTAYVFRPDPPQWDGIDQGSVNGGEAAHSSQVESAEVEPTNAEVESSNNDLLSTASSAGAGYNAQGENPKVLYVGNMFFQTTEEQLSQEFGQFGDILRTTIVRDRTGLSKGFGYVEFSSESSAAEAIVAMNQRILDGRRLTVQIHKKRAPSDIRITPRRNEQPNVPSKTLFIGNLAYEMSDAELNELFRDIRNVLDVRVAIDRRTGQPRGFAHADFLDETSATKALEQLQNKEVHGRILRVDYTQPSVSRRRQE